MSHRHHHAPHSDFQGLPLHHCSPCTCSLAWRNHCVIFMQHWSKLDHLEGKPCPMVRNRHAAVCLDYSGAHPQLLVTGGLGNGNKVLSDTWMLDVQSGRWREVNVSSFQSRCLQSAAASSLSPGLTEVIIFGGCIEWPSNPNSDADFPQMANTTVLRFESQQCPSTGGPPTREWVLTDIADSTQLGTRERVTAKVKKIQATYKVAATGDEIWREESVQDAERSKSEKLRKVKEVLQVYRECVGQEMCSEGDCWRLQGGCYTGSECGEVEECKEVYRLYREGAPPHSPSTSSHPPPTSPHSPKPYTIPPNPTLTSPHTLLLPPAHCLHPQAIHHQPPHTKQLSTTSLHLLLTSPHHPPILMVEGAGKLVKDAKWLFLMVWQEWWWHQGYMGVSLALACHTLPPHTISSYSGSKPDLSFLLVFEWQDSEGVKQRRKILKNVSAEWKEIGRLVGLGEPDLTRFKQLEQSDIYECCVHVFTHWINNDGHSPKYPLSWKGLHDLLYDIDHEALANDLKEALASKGVHFH